MVPFRFSTIGFESTHAKPLEAVVVLAPARTQKNGIIILILLDITADIHALQWMPLLAIPRPTMCSNQ